MQICLPLERRDPAWESGGLAAWCGSSTLLDVDEPRLRIRALMLTQLCKGEREKLLALYAFVRRMPFVKPLKLRLHTAREVLDAGRGDAEDKASLLVALLRASGFPSRLRYVELHGDILRGLTTAIASAARPVVEVWTAGAWVGTDTFIFDPGYINAARRRLAREGWEWGYGIHVRGHGLWDGLHSAFLTGPAHLSSHISMGDLGYFHDPLDFVRSPVCQTRFPRVARAVRWGMVSSSMNQAVTDLREDAIRDRARKLPTPAVDNFVSFR